VRDGGLEAINSLVRNSGANAPLFRPAMVFESRRSCSRGSSMI
jgi:hypothetical protein